MIRDGSDPRMENGLTCEAFIGGCDEEDKAQEQIALLVSHIGDAVEKMHTPNMKKVINARVRSCTPIWDVHRSAGNI